MDESKDSFIFKNINQERKFLIIKTIKLDLDEI